MKPSEALRLSFVCSSQRDLSNVSAPELMVVFVASLTNMRVSLRYTEAARINDLMLQNN